MRLSAFIHENLDAIVAEWENFARSLRVPAPLTDSELRDHCLGILQAIAVEMETAQTDTEQSAKSKEISSPPGKPENAAMVHGSLRHVAGFDLKQLVGEFRAMRASVLALWNRTHQEGSQPSLEEFTRFNEALDKALSESVDSYSNVVAASRDMFLAVLGHDLRSPLSVIDMSSQLLAKAQHLPEATREKTLLRIRRASREMNRLITDLLEFTRTRLGSGIPIERVACDLGAVCEGAVDAVQASEPEHTFDLQLSGDLNLQADASRVRQVLSNLLHNAVQHGSMGTVVEVAARGETDAVLLTVSNTGKTIPAEALQSIFDPLVQLADPEFDPQRRSGTSLGLGLFIVRQIVEGHGGEVSVASTPESRTVFTVRLPRC